MEVIIYQADHPQIVLIPPVAPPPQKSVTAETTFSRILSTLAKISVSLSIIFLAVSYGPGSADWVKNALGAASANFNLSPPEITYLKAAAKNSGADYFPPVNSGLPPGNHLIISSIGVNADISEATLDNYEEALKKGVWRVSDFGAPWETGVPVILAAHRYGYLAWTNLYRRQNSFFNLPKLKIGDTIEIDYQQRKYIYEVYAEGVGESITDYTANLILYTCENLTGNTRIFKYARLIKN